MIEKRRYSVAFVPRVTQVYDKEKDKQLSSFELDDLLLKFEKENKKLKEELRIYRQLAEENEQLKTELKAIREERHKEFMIGNGR